MIYLKSPKSSCNPTPSRDSYPTNLALPESKIIIENYGHEILVDRDRWSNFEKFYAQTKKEQTFFVPFFVNAVFRNYFNSTKPKTGCQPN